MKKTVILIAMMVIFAGCKDKKIDSSSDENLKKSKEVVKKSLSSEKRQEFEEAIEAIEAIAMSEIGNIFEAAANPERMQRRIKDKINGKTANEIIAEGNRIIAERRGREREQAVIEIREQAVIEIEEIEEEIAELEKKQAKTEQGEEQLKQFKVLRSQFYFQKGSFSEEPVIELTVKNETAYAVSRVHFEGVLATPGRSVPWIKDSFNYQIRGGLEPGEKATWKLAPNMFGEWGEAPKDRNDMVLTVTVKRIDGADEKAIFDSSFLKLEEMRLEELSQRLEKLKKNLIN